MSLEQTVLENHAPYDDVVIGESITEKNNNLHSVLREGIHRNKHNDSERFIQNRT
jgi:hypothetical protein